MVLKMITMQQVYHAMNMAVVPVRKIQLQGYFITNVVKMFKMLLVKMAMWPSANHVANFY